MCTLENTPIPITVVVEGEEVQLCSYKVRSVHRRHGNNNKCIWTISIEEEVKCFKDSACKNWLENKEGWGLKLNATNGGLEQVGLSEIQEVLKIAKFVDSNLTKEWHGYPADYCRRINDKPSLRVLNDWREKGIISKTQMGKITRGQKCNL
jgi:hypothetical protein